MRYKLVLRGSISNPHTIEAGKKKTKSQIVQAWISPMTNCVIKLMQCPGTDGFQMLSAGTQNPMRMTIHMMFTITEMTVTT